MLTVLRNITGDTGLGWSNPDMNPKMEGGFFRDTHNRDYQRAELTSKLSIYADDTVGFDASRVVPTSSEARPTNIAFLPLIAY